MLTNRIMMCLNSAVFSAGALEVVENEMSALAAVEPLRAHVVRGCAAVPKAAVGLRAPEDDEEAHEDAEACPGLCLGQDAVVRLHEGQEALVDGVADASTDECAGERGPRRSREDTAFAPEDVHEPRNPMV
eukprot:CAMPEP_0175231026 /NCGR_PEP_ID=MMETSP0093-20121207/25248_1 /TAXON_ID=311494 /ORGANISM="Alexandrium monilatum, Strain CCMP3105" /LENGTH=130 /DNA_ID=CAMNT_0016524873 /DNA_START=301 /DNA_END=695 /DNA_ORIENTATION=+